MIIKGPLNTIVQSLTTGNVWTGVTPSSNATYPLDAEKEFTGLERCVIYDESTTGGKFDIVGERNNFKRLIGMNDRGVGSIQRIEQVSLTLGGQSSWKLNLTNGTDTITIFSGTTETNVFRDELSIIIEPFWFVELITTGNSTGTHMARITFYSILTYLLVT